MKLTSEIYRERFHLMDNRDRWIRMVIISTTRDMNVTRVMINTTTTIVVQKEEMRVKSWMRYYLPLFLS